MSSDDDYLWDGSGAPDEDVARLERVMGELKYRAPAQPRAAAASGAAPASGVAPADELAARRRLGRWVIAGSGAVIAAAAAVAFMLWLHPRPTVIVKRLTGFPCIAAQPIAETARLAVGKWLETDDTSGAQIALAGLGAVDVGPRSRVRVQSIGAREQRLELARGEIHAYVTAPPRLFVVDTPAASAVDLGCEYTLTVDEHEVSRLRVTRGEVELAGAGRVSRVPAGSRCETHPRSAPGIPVADDAPEPLARALSSWEARGGRDALDAALASARKDDAASLWNLLARTDGAARDAVYARLSALVAAPEPAPPKTAAQMESLWSKCNSD
jgi:FecR protein